MATSEFWQTSFRICILLPRMGGRGIGSSSRNSRGTVKLWMFLDVLTILGSAMLATLYEVAHWTGGRRTRVLARYAYSRPFRWDPARCFSADSPSL